ncbi:MAG: glycosyltransferase family 61 protein [Okeania sp. SIO3B5]|uniref:glycosyltransferase family 61 protein n=1 Tax=Okeania sp. SIO3B5 TaxID=2607811 RepID=UPI00140005D7|nr:glycosyltransferase family 61 protein [Okeania sp. SIO3B5]NEO53877.1 glycosyltransferase family 61 protein [Okeania sp. SIO3B5]
MFFLQNLTNWKNSVQTTLRKLLIKTISIDELSKAQNLQKLSPISDQVTATPEIKEMSLLSNSKHLIDENYSVPNIYSVTLTKVIYLSSRYNLFFTKSRKLIGDSLIYKNQLKNIKKISLSGLYLKKPERLLGTYSIFRTYKSYKNYYHSLIDNIPRLYLLHQDEYKKIPEIKLLVSSELTKLEDYYLKKLLPENAKVFIVKPNNFYFLEKLIFPQLLTSYNAGYLPSEYLEFFMNKIKPNRERNKVNRIFISRKNSRSRHILNEDEILDRLAIHGFKKYFLEELSITEQIELFYDADYVIGVHGAGLVNLIFASEINVLEIFSTSYVIPHYYYLAKSLNHTYKHWCCDSKGGKNTPSFIVDAEELLKKLNL